MENEERKLKIERERLAFQTEAQKASVELAAERIRIATELMGGLTGEELAAHPDTFALAEQALLGAARIAELAEHRKIDVSPLGRRLSKESTDVGREPA